jgi:hypothetical protein
MSRADNTTITEVTPSHFGPYYNTEQLRSVDGKYPSAIIVAIHKGGGLEPVQLMLPHQLYMQKAEEIMKAHGARELWVYPVFDSTAWTQVTILPEGEWQKAQPGDMWVLTFKGETVSALTSTQEGYNGNMFFIHGEGWVSCYDSRITEGKIVHCA